MPEITFKSLDAIPEGLREGAKAVNGEYVINVVPKTQLDSFRDNNIKYLQERDEARTVAETYKSLVGADVEKAKAELTELRGIAQQVKDGTLKVSTDVQKQVDARVAELKAQLDGRIKATEERAAAKEAEALAAKRELDRSRIERGIMGAILAADSAANPAAADDILARAMNVFTVGPTGALIPKEGETIIYGADGASPMSPKEWLEKLLVKAPHFSKASVGGGAGGDPKNKAQFGGMSEEAFYKLPPERRIEIHRAAQEKR